MKECFKTRDLATAALLLSSEEVQFQGLEPHYNRSKYFLFSPKAKAERIAIDFVAGRVVINARTYADSFKRSKDVLFEAGRTIGA